MKTESASILVVDDEFSVRDSLCHWFKKDGHKVDVAADAMEALAKLDAATRDVVLVDIKMPGMDGITLQERIHAIDPKIAVIVITAFASVETAVRALKQGAFDYVTKPVDPTELSHLVRLAVEARRQRGEPGQQHETVEELVPSGTLVGDSPAMLKVMELVKHVAQTDATVLLRGESGTGKELIARAIHANSRRRYFPIVPVNCGAVPENLLESELFGHEKGAFTGAQYQRKGKIEMADGGTLFLDEAGTISPEMQVDLLRVLETKELTRVGGSKSIKVDFRTICATNEDLEALVKAGKFREDLYYRINVFAIEVPPLRERREDIPALANHFVKRLAAQMDKKIVGIDRDAMERLVAHDWPGNVRELANAIERAMVVAKPPSLRLADLPALGAPVEGLPSDSLAEVERRHIQRVLNAHAWNITRAAEVLQIDRATLYNKIKKFDLRK